MKKIFTIFLVTTLILYTQTPALALIAMDLNETNTEIFEEEFIDDGGKNNKLVTEQNGDFVRVSLYIDGRLEQQSTVLKKTGKVTGFSDYGNENFEKELDELVTVELDLDNFELPTVTPKNSIQILSLPHLENDGSGGSYINVAERKTVSNALCTKQVTAKLYEKTTNSQTAKLNFNYSTGELITTILAGIVAALILKTPLTLTFIQQLIVGTGTSVAGSKILSGLKGYYQVKVQVKDYYASIGTGKYFTNTITKETMVMYNQQTGKDASKVIGTHVTAYGKPTDYQVMLSQALLNWANATQCK